MKKNYKPSNVKAIQQQTRLERDKLERSFGYEMFAEGPDRVGWLLNSIETTIGISNDINAVQLYFIEQDGSCFKSTILYRPYFYVIVKEPFERYCYELIAALQKRFEEKIYKIEVIDKLDLDMPNHWDTQLSCLKVTFANTANLQLVRMELNKKVKSNAMKAKVTDVYRFSQNKIEYQDSEYDIFNTIIELREFDVPFETRVGIDLNLFIGSWYSVTAASDTELKSLGCVSCVRLDKVEKPNTKVFAFDIECCKQPLKFPDPKLVQDEIFMISYMVNREGFLLINRKIVAEDISDFEYSPREEFTGTFKVVNLQDEKELLIYFFEHIKEIKPNIFVTYNGDNFDFWYIEIRAKLYSLEMANEIGFSNSKTISDNTTLFDNNKEYLSSCCSHIDCLYWVKRDSYLPAGSRSLKKVTSAKLGFDPIEIHPEKMVELAKTSPQEMANYSVSDALCTYYLYEKYINNFIFSLCTIIPMPSDKVLRKGSGTLCEMLLLTEAFNNNIISPNKHSENSEKFNDAGNVIDSETYVGGHVECLESGVFRADLNYTFEVDFEVIDRLISNVRKDLKFNIEVENKAKIEDCTNFDDVVVDMQTQLNCLKRKNIVEKAKIYHLDVSAMYPNIILTNRLQPTSIVNESTCASCKYREDRISCQRKMDWMWRGDLLPCTKGEYMMIKTQLDHDYVQTKNKKKTLKYKEELKKRLTKFCENHYRKRKTVVTEQREGIVCQRENSFYVDTVRKFRDRRYEYKRLTKKFAKEKSRLKEEKANGIEVIIAEDKQVLYDSLQLAHKCILNSFYGYVMRKGARWFSMEMAAMVTHTGANIIKQAKCLIEGIGRVLELDTDGVWCILPNSFPENFLVNMKNGKSIQVSYPCMMLNCLTHNLFSNHQYQTLQISPEGAKSYLMHSECSIFFEVDGPYRCMVIPASQEENKLLKKRYAVFNFDGSLAELKGFELKRRGELNIIKHFQSQCFPYFLQGSSLQACYEAVAEVANKWIQVLVSKGQGYSNEQIIDLLAEDRSMSKALSEYGDRKSNSITTAKRLSEFLGEEMVQNAGLSCKLLISREPSHAATSERALPCAIFSAEPKVRNYYLEKWTGLKNTDIKNVIDWEYYLERLGATVAKIISIPAILQGVSNPVTHITLPKWVYRKKIRCKKITTFFKKGNHLSKRKRILAKTIVKKRDSEIIPDSSLYAYDKDFTEWLADRKRRWKVGVKLAKKINGGNMHRLTENEKVIAKSTLKVSTLDKFISKSYIPSSHWNLTDIVRIRGSLFKLGIIRNGYFHEVYVCGANSEAEIVVRLGCVATLHKGVDTSRGSLQRPYAIEELKHLSVTTQPYLQSISEAYIYVWSFRNSIFVVLFSFAEPRNTVQIDGQKLYQNAEVNIWSTTKDDTVHNQSPQDILNQLLAKSHLDAREYNVNLERGSFNDGYKNEYSLYSAIEKHMSLRNINTAFLVVQSNRTEEIALRKIFGKKYALLFLPMEATNFDISSQFRQHFLRNAIVAYIRYKYTADLLIDIASYGYIPISMLKKDVTEQVYSYFFARMLFHNNISYHKQQSKKTVTLDDFKQTSLPQKDDAPKEVFVQQESDHPLIQEIHAYTSHLKVLKYEQSSIFRSWTIKVSIGCLVINAILKANEILAFEGSRMQQFTQNFNDCARKFEILKSIVHNLVHDATKNGSYFADSLLQNIYRIVTDSTSQFFDVQLAALVEQLLRKAFYQLLSEIDSFGAQVVFGNKEYIIISTGKKSCEEAKLFFESLKQHIKSIDMFKILYFKMSDLYKSLIFINENNYVTIKEEDSKSKLGLHLEAISNLSEDCVDLIEDVLHELMCLTFKEFYAKKEVKHIVETKIQNILLNFTSKAKTKYVEQQDKFLEAQKAVLISLFMVELDDSVKSAVTVIRRCCFRVFETSEFAEAVSLNKSFFSPKYSVILRNLTCNRCYYCADYNLTNFCKTNIENSSLCCNDCGKEFSTRSIENLITNKFELEVKRRLLTDFICSSCGYMRESLMSLKCASCSGDYIEVEETSELWNPNIICQAYHDIGIKFKSSKLIEIAKYFEKF